MGFTDWLKSHFRRPARRDGLVPFYDVPSRRLVGIPAAELLPTCARASVAGAEITDGLAWVIPEQLRPSQLRHPPFDEGVRSYIRDVHCTFAVQRPLSFDEWEDNFRRAADPLREIAVWSHAADVYREFATDEPSADRRGEIYQLIVACLTVSPDLVLPAVRPRALSRRESKRVVRRFLRSFDPPRSGGVLPLPEVPAPRPVRKEPRPSPAAHPGLRRQRRRAMREGLLTSVAGVLVAAFVTYCATKAASSWAPHDPNPVRLLAVLLTYTGCLAAGTATLAAVLHWLGLVSERRRPDGPSQPPLDPPANPPRPPPPERSPSGVPVGPRRPAPLVAHARPPVDDEFAPEEEQLALVS